MKAPPLHHSAVIGGKTIDYTATAGYLVTPIKRWTPSCSAVAFTQDNQTEESRPVSFSNCGPGSSSVSVLGSFAPQRIKTSTPAFIRAPTDGGQPDSCRQGDLSSTGWIPDNEQNRDFWGVDQDLNLASIKRFLKTIAGIRRNFYMASRTARAHCVAYLLHEDGVDLNGITRVMTLTTTGNLGRVAAPPMPGFIKLATGPRIADVREEVAQFADGLRYRENSRRRTTTPWKLSEYTGIDKATLIAWSLDVASYDSRGNSAFSHHLPLVKRRAPGSDGRTVNGDCGQDRSNSGGNDPTMTADRRVHGDVEQHLNEIDSRPPSFTDPTTRLLPTDFHHKGSDRRRERMDAGQHHSHTADVR